MCGIHLSEGEKSYVHDLGCHQSPQFNSAYYCGRRFQIIHGLTAPTCTCAPQRCCTEKRQQFFQCMGERWLKRAVVAEMSMPTRESDPAAENRATATHVFYRQQRRKVNAGKCCRKCVSGVKLCSRSSQHKTGLLFQTINSQYTLFASPVGGGFRYTLFTHKKPACVCVCAA